jgi:hypothetical protein
MGGVPEQMLAAEVAAGGEPFPAVAPGASAIPPLNLAV